MVSDLFGDVIGHERLVALLDRELEAPGSAYLFVGPAGVGKATLARRFAAGLVGGATDAGVSRRALAGIHPDVVIVEPAGKTMLSVDQAREMIAQSVLMPVEADKKVFVIEEAGSMSEGASNALLKTLEEPPRSTIFLLAVQPEQEIPDTIPSRCRTMHVGRVSSAVIVDHLVATGLSPERAEQVSRIAGGRPGLAVRLATDPNVESFRSSWLAVPTRLSATASAHLDLAEELLAATEPLLAGMKTRAELTAAEAVPQAKDRVERDLARAGRSLTVSGLEILASWYGDAASAQFGGPVRNPDIPVADLALIKPRVAVRNAERVLEAVQDLEANLRPKLVLASMLGALSE